MSDPNPAPRRLRIQSLTVVPVLVWDDGEELSPGPQVDPIAIPLSAFADFAENFPGEVSELGATLEEQRAAAAAEAEPTS